MLNDGNFKRIVKMNISSFHYAVPLFCQEKKFLFCLSTEGNYSGYFLNVPPSWQRRSDGPGANVNLRILWLTPALNVALRVLIASPRTFLTSRLN
jgi:hypothetical protein